MILWLLCIALAGVGFSIGLTTVLLLMWQMIEVGLLWVVVLIATMFAVYVAVVLWDRFVKGPPPEETPEETAAAADLW